jgi:hypothetical protein
VRSDRPESVETSFPSTAIVPAVMRVSRRIIFPTVVLPLPLSPISETTSPRSIEKVTPVTAGSAVPPNVPVR